MDRMKDPGYANFAKRLASFKPSEPKSLFCACATRADCLLSKSLSARPAVQWLNISQDFIPAIRAVGRQDSFAPLEAVAAQLYSSQGARSEASETSQSPQRQWQGGDPTL